ncbi:hypothetical protein [Listeria ilorinensis]|uniref:hypothetical protein n=1 Tax=Listeria ilorinensis TaxID=2867439 RepID=UPI001EF54FEC|nr:hypothetical protein [Listeria ilorinensis]
MTTIARELTKKEQVALMERSKSLGIKAESNEEKLTALIDQLRAAPSFEEEEIEETAYRYGLFFGELLRTAFEWHWLFLEIEDQSGYAIVSKENGYALLVMPYFTEILAGSREPGSLKALYQLMPSIEGEKNAFRLL